MKKLPEKNNWEVASNANRILHTLLSLLTFDTNFRENKDFSSSKICLFGTFNPLKSSSLNSDLDFYKSISRIGHYLLFCIFSSNSLKLLSFQKGPISQVQQREPAGFISSTEAEDTDMEMLGLAMPMRDIKASGLSSGQLGTEIRRNRMDRQVQETGGIFQMEVGKFEYC